MTITSIELISTRQADPRFPIPGERDQTIYQVRINNSEVYDWSASKYRVETSVLAWNNRAAEIASSEWQSLSEAERTWERKEQVLCAAQAQASREGF